MEYIWNRFNACNPSLINVKSYAETKSEPAVSYVCEYWVLLWEAFFCSRLSTPIFDYIISTETRSQIRFITEI